MQKDTIKEEMEMKSAEQLIREVREEWTALAHKYGFEWDKDFFEVWSVNHALVIAKTEALEP